MEEVYMGKGEKMFSADIRWYTVRLNALGTCLTHAEITVERGKKSHVLHWKPINCNRQAQSESQLISIKLPPIIIWRLGKSTPTWKTCGPDVVTLSEDDVCLTRHLERRAINLWEMAHGSQWSGYMNAIMLCWPSSSAGDGRRAFQHSIKCYT